MSAGPLQGYRVKTEVQNISYYFNKLKHLWYLVLCDDRVKPLHLYTLHCTVALYNVNHIPDLWWRGMMCNPSVVERDYVISV